MNSLVTLVHFATIRLALRQASTSGRLQRILPKMAQHDPTARHLTNPAPAVSSAMGLPGGASKIQNGSEGFKGSLPRPWLQPRVGRLLGMES